MLTNTVSLNDDWILEFGVFITDYAQNFILTICRSAITHEQYHFIYKFNEGTICPFRVFP